MDPLDEELEAGEFTLGGPGPAEADRVAGEEVARARVRAALGTEEHHGEGGHHEHSTHRDRGEILGGTLEHRLHQIETLIHEGAGTIEDLTPAAIETIIEALIAEGLILPEPVIDKKHQVSPPVRDRLAENLTHIAWSGGLRTPRLVKDISVLVGDALSGFGTQRMRQARVQPYAIAGHPDMAIGVLVARRPRPVKTRMEKVKAWLPNDLPYDPVALMVFRTEGGKAAFRGDGELTPAMRKVVQERDFRDLKLEHPEGLHDLRPRDELEGGSVRIGPPELPELKTVIGADGQPEFVPVDRAAVEREEADRRREIDDALMEEARALAAQDAVDSLPPAPPPAPPPPEAPEPPPPHRTRSRRASRTTLDEWRAMQAAAAAAAAIPLAPPAPAAPSAPSHPPIPPIPPHIAAGLVMGPGSHPPIPPEISSRLVMGSPAAPPPGPVPPVAPSSPDRPYSPRHLAPATAEAAGVPDAPRGGEAPPAARERREHSTVEGWRPEDGFTDFSLLVHRVQDEKRFGVPSSGRLLNTQIRQLLAVARTEEDIETIEQEMFRRDRQVAEDAQKQKRRERRRGAGGPRMGIDPNEVDMRGGPLIAGMRYRIVTGPDGENALVDQRPGDRDTTADIAARRAQLREEARRAEGAGSRLGGRHVGAEAPAAPVGPQASAEVPGGAGRVEAAADATPPLPPEGPADDEEGGDGGRDTDPEVVEGELLEGERATARGLMAQLDEILMMSGPPSERLRRLNMLEAYARRVNPLNSGLDRDLGRRSTDYSAAELLRYWDAHRRAVADANRQIEEQRRLANTIAESEAIRAERARRPQNTEPGRPAIEAGGGADTSPEG